MDLTNLNNDKKERRKAKPDLSTMIYGKVPPQAREMEEAVLGAIMLEKDAFDTVSDILKPECFYVDAHKRIFQAMRTLAQRSQPIDALTVAEELRSREELDLVGGPYYITKLTNAVVSAANIEAHCRIILQKFIARELIRISGETISDAYEESTDVFDLLDQAEEKLSNVGQATNIGDMVGIDTVLVQAVQKIEEWRALDSPITGIPSGFTKFDKATRGWQNGDLIIIAARPSVGKTALALNIVKTAAQFFLNQRTGKTVAVWSLEMKALMLVLRMLAAESREILHKIQTGRMDDQAMNNLFHNGIQKLASLGIFFDDSSGVTLQRLRTKARKLKRKNELGLIVVDYLQLMTPDERKGTREQEISNISRGLKNLAQELDIPIIALSQLSREVEKRQGANKNKPQLSDLRESGAIEQDADVVIFLWGPTEEEIANDASLLTKRYLRIAKQRNGMLITIEVDFKDEIQLFTDISSVPGLPGNFRTIKDFTEPSEAKLFVQPGTKLNDLTDEEDPF